MNVPAFLNTITTRTYSLPIVILYVTAGCNLRCIMCSYRDSLPNELTLDEVKELSGELARLGLRHIVYSGGEPLTRRDFPQICKMFTHTGVKQSLLTNGVLLQKRYEDIHPYLSEIIVSIDGPTAGIHDEIRGVEMFDRIITGIQKVISSANRPKISIRTVVQKKNFREMAGMVKLAKSLGVDRISFLAADVLSGAFHRDYAGPATEQSEVMLNKKETTEFRKVMENFVDTYQKEIKSGFISENTGKLFHLVNYFEALAGNGPLPRNVCNAPMISTVITSTGDVLPCYFLPSIGNIRRTPIKQLLDDDNIRTTRKKVKEYSLKQCHECVCTLKINSFGALANSF